MDKRYQVFVSSTFKDLEEERQKVMRILLDMNCIPAGMEFFPAMDMEQFEYIKRLIDDSDYYVLIIGGRYGSLSEQGISYTEMEYDYAVQKGIPVIAFLHSDLEAIPLGKSEKEENKRQQLAKFRDKASKGRLVKEWHNADELCGKVAVSLIQTINQFPAEGWVRANLQTNVESLQELNTLRKELDSTKKELAQLKNEQQNIKKDDLAELDEKIRVRGTYTYIGSGCLEKWECKITWKQLFDSIAPFLLEIPADETVQKMLASICYSATGNTLDSNEIAYIDLQDFQTIKVQLMALNVINVTYTKTNKGGMALFWKLTDTGKQLMMQLRTIKTTKPNPFKQDNK